MDKGQLENLRLIFNKEHPKEAISSGPPAQIWKDLQLRFHKRCEEGLQCITSEFMKKENAPESWTTNPKEWLSSVDIDKIEKQFAKLFTGYKYLGTIPIDFDKKSETGTCIVDSLCAINLDALQKKGFTRIGIVFNTDVSTGPGQHWVAVYCDIRPELEYPRFTYFDSYAEQPESEIQKLMYRWKEEWDLKHPEKMVLTYNKTRHQYQDSECGMYSLIFHYYCLNEIPMDERISDDVARGLRSLFFNIGKK
jgi:hypothetical protein